MYFDSRTAAGQKLAKSLTQYQYKDVVVLALSEGGVMVGAQIAAELHCPIMYLLTQDIVLPGEITAVGVVDQDGGFTYNDHFSSGELDEMVSEYHGTIEQMKETKWHEINRLLSDDGLVDAKTLSDKTLIIVSDGFLSGSSLLATMNYLKPVKLGKIVIATPIASVTAVDKMHIIGDELCVLEVMDDILDIDHYYEEKDIPTQDEIIKILNEAQHQWK